jgi:hypothetical protein
MSTYSNYSYQNQDSLRAVAQSLINRYDRNGDGRLSRDEAEQQISLGADSYSFTSRLSGSQVQRTTVYENKYATLDSSVIARAGQYGDSLGADELVQIYMDRAGSSYNSYPSASGLRATLEHTSNVETDRSTSYEYNPSSYYSNDPYTTYYPSTDYYPTTSPYYRPAPPIVVDPYYPSNPYSSGPTPPSPNYRPSPPSTSGGYSPSRPTPPSSSGGYNRPSPPSSSGGYTPSSRPTPPSPTGRPGRP